MVEVKKCFGSNLTSNFMLNIVWMMISTDLYRINICGILYKVWQTKLVEIYFYGYYKMHYDCIAWLERMYCTYWEWLFLKSMTTNWSFQTVNVECGEYEQISDNRLEVIQNMVLISDNSELKIFRFSENTLNRHFIWSVFCLSRK
jgi:hypothetical protein